MPKIIYTCIVVATIHFSISSVNAEIISNASFNDFNKNRGVTKIETMFAFFDRNDTASLVITIKDEKDFWLFNSLEKFSMSIYTGNTKKYYRFAIDDPETWVEDDTLLCSETRVSISSDALKDILHSNEVRLSFEFDNVYVRRDYLFLEFNQEILNEWYYVCKGENSTFAKNQSSSKNPEPEKKYSSYKETNVEFQGKYKVSDRVRLNNTSDDIVPIYSGSSLKDTIVFFTNGIKAEILEVGKEAYKVEVGDYVGWIPESVIVEK